jgi:hypothetical protein
MKWLFAHLTENAERAKLTLMVPFTHFGSQMRFDAFLPRTLTGMLRKKNLLNAPTNLERHHIARVIMKNNKIWSEYVLFLCDEEP